MIEKEQAMEALTKKAKQFFIKIIISEIVIDFFFNIFSF